MKKVLSILLSFAMLATMTAGLNLKAFAANVESISLNLANGGIEYYEHWHGYTETEGNVEYYHYDVDMYDLLAEGNTLQINYDDNSSKTFECVREYRNDEEYDLVYKCGNETLEAEDENNVYISAQQDADNQWTVNNSYTATLWFYGASSDFSVSIIPNPVDDVQITWEKPITIPEYGHGEWVNNDDPESPWFMYYANNLYLNEAGVCVNVDYTDGTHKEFRYFGNDWLPKDEDGNELNGDYFEFGFAQMHEGRHLYSGIQNRTAVLYYYGKGTESIPLNVVSGDINSGSISENEIIKVLFCGSENHNITFTPQEDGV